MLRSLTLLALASLTAAAEDWDSRCRALASNSPAERRSAQEAIRRAGPEVERPLAAMESSEDTAAAQLAKLCRLARRWDPDCHLFKLEPLLDVERGEAEGVLSAVSQLVQGGSLRAGDAVSRILAARPEAEIPALLAAVTGGPQRDPGWARVAAKWLASGTPAIRVAAARTVAAHGNGVHAPDLRLAIGRERDGATRAELWRSLMQIVQAPEELPLLPEDPELYAQVIEMAAREARRPQLCKFAWQAWESRRTARPVSEFTTDLPRLARLAGIDSVEDSFERPAWVGELDPSVARRLASSRNLSARLTVAHEAVDFPQAYLLAVSVLEDSDAQVRLAAIGQLAEDFGAWTEETESVQIEHHRRMGEAARTALEAALGLATIAEIRVAAREIVSAARENSGLAGLAMFLLAAMGADGRDALAELESDPDLGVAAANARRVLVIEVPPGQGIFNEGLDARPWIGWYPYDLPTEKWLRFARSNEADDRACAAALLPCAWDFLSLRAEIREILPSLLADDDSHVKDLSRRFASEEAADLLPEEEALAPGEAWSRPRGYVLKRLRAAQVAMKPLDAELAYATSSRGDRALVLAAARADRFPDDQARDVIAFSGEPGILPLLLARFANLEVAAWPAWFYQVTRCGPEGCRWAARFAESGTPDQRGFALAALLASAWGAELAVSPLEDLASREDEDSVSALLVAVNNGGIRWRPKLPRRSADALAKAVLRFADTPALEDRLPQLLSSLGPQALRDASPGLLASLASDPWIVDLATDCRAWIGAVPNLRESLFSGPPLRRAGAAELLPGNNLEDMGVLLHAWLESKHFLERFDPWGSRASLESQVTFLLDAAARDETNRDSILELRRRLLLYSSPTPPVAETAPAGWRAMEGTMPPEFLSDSMQDRESVLEEFSASLSTASFANLCAAAFRGASGDELAIDALRLRFGPDALPSLVPLLSRPDPHVRGSAALAIAHAAGPARNFAAASLRASLGTETDGEARERLLAGLARLEDAAALDELRLAGSAENPDRRISAARSLALSPTRAAAAILARLTDDADAGVRNQASASLQLLTGRPPDPAAIPFHEADDWSAWLAANPAAALREPEPESGHRFAGYDMEW
ncbi:MAG: hypothetical protein K8T20_09850 [Planctomycetes bacterium]|nr:hypothetical protein [Planctomycetota bacterium]